MTIKSGTILILPDFQVPYHDLKTVDALVDIVEEVQPTRLVHIGDFLDAPEPARWNKGMAMEYSDTLQAGIDEGVSVLERFREVYDGPFDLKYGNHDERVETYVNKYAPALGSLKALKVDALLRLDRLGITPQPRPFDVAPGWIAAHGHEGSLRHSAGGTAMALAKKIGKSVVCGHTHKVGLINETIGLFGKTYTLTGMEVGHAMTFEGAHYLKMGAANWQQGFGLLHVHNGMVTPQPVMFTARRTVLQEGF